MGRKSTVTYEQVSSAAEQIHMQGGRPNAKAIRSNLGDTGSMGTIQQHLMTWRSTAEPAAAGTRMLPSDIHAAIFRLVDFEVAACRQQASSDVENANRDTANLADDNVRQLEIINAQQEEIAALTAELAVSRGRHEQVRADKDDAREAMARLQDQLHEMRAQHVGAEVRLTRLLVVEQALSEAQGKYESEREARVNAELQAAISEAGRQALENEVENLRADPDFYKTSHFNRRERDHPKSSSEQEVELSGGDEIATKNPKRLARMAKPGIADRDNTTTQIDLKLDDSTS